MSETVNGQLDVVRTVSPEVIGFRARVVGAAAGFLPTALVIRLDAETGEAIIGQSGQSGTLRLVNAQGLETVTLDAGFSNLRMGGNGTDGDILLFSGAGNRDDNGAATIHLDGQAGDILLRNGDCAEEFDVVEADAVAPGSLLSLGAEGKLLLSREPYDRKVVGVVSGAGDTRPGIILARDKTRTGRLPIALAGRVNTWVDASFGPIGVGDLLTTSDHPGHAMRARDSRRAFGSVIGKAMRPLPSGCGLIPVLVALQ
jgi:hypothetical protein